MPKPSECLGWDRCDICGLTRPLFLYLNKNIGKLIEIEPDGRLELRCQECIDSGVDTPMSV